MSGVTRELEKTHFHDFLLLLRFMPFPCSVHLIGQAWGMSLRDDYASNTRMIESTAGEWDYDNAVNNNVWLMDGGWCAWKSVFEVCFRRWFPPFASCCWFWWPSVVHCGWGYSWHLHDLKRGQKTLNGAFIHVAEKDLFWYFWLKWWNIRRWKSPDLNVNIWQTTWFEYERIFNSEEKNWWTKAAFYLLTMGAKMVSPIFYTFANVLSLL